MTGTQTVTRKLHTQQVLRVTARALIGCYAVLVFLATMCSFSHGNHQHGSTAHSAFCAWMCQANPGVSLVSSEPVSPALILVIFFITLMTKTFHPHSPLFVRSRAPPRKA